jgi:hypothetical protein
MQFPFSRSSFDRSFYHKKWKIPDKLRSFAQQQRKKRVLVLAETLVELNFIFGQWEITLL